jgi:hypothetical protein
MLLRFPQDFLALPPIIQGDNGVVDLLHDFGRPGYILAPAEQLRRRKSPNGEPARKHCRLAPKLQ